MWQIPLIGLAGGALEGSGMVIEKKILRKHSINYKNYTVYGFLSLVLVMLPFIFFFWKMEPEAYQPLNILIFLSVILFSILANLLIFYSLKRETVTELEPIRLMQPLFTILLAVLFSFIFDGAYAAERNLMIVGLALIASISLVASHIKKHHLNFDKYILAALLGSFLFAVELVISRSILHHYNSLTFYFIRALFVFLITLIIFRPQLESLKTNTKWLIMAGGAIWVIYRLILYWGYLTYGIVFTTILFIISPIFIYVFARIFLNEKITWRHILSSIIIVACVIAAILLNQ
jgi:drug/metabolite transporter (DMT)-like permease